MGGPSGVLINGVERVEPGVYMEPRYSAGSGVPVGAKIPTLVGDFPWLEQGVPRLVGSQGEMEALDIGNEELKRLAGLVFRPHLDDRVAGVPSGCMLSSALATTQAQLTVADASSVNSLVFKSRVWGRRGALTNITITASGSDRTFVFERDGATTETFSALGTDDLFSVYYKKSADKWTTAVLSINTDGDGKVRLAVSATIAADATLDIDEYWSGLALTATPSDAPSGQSYSLTIVGLDDVGDAATEVLTWADGDAADAKTTSTVFTHITSLAWATSGAATDTVTVEGYQFSSTASTHPTVGSLYDHFAAYTDDLYTLSIVNGTLYPSERAVYVETLDALTPSSIVGYGAARTFTNAVSNIITALEGSALVEVTSAGLGGGLPVATARTRLVGGLETDSDVSAALTPLSPLHHWTIAMLSTSAADHAILAAHLNERAATWSVDAIVPAGVGESLTALSARINTLNNMRIGLVAQEVQVYGPRGTKEWLPPKYEAVLLAALRCSVGYGSSINGLKPNVLDVRQSTTWSWKTPTAPTKAGITFIGDHPVNGLHWVRAVTTIRTTSEDNRTEQSSVDSSNACNNYVRLDVEAYFGADPNANLTEAEVTNFLRGSLQRRKDENMIAWFNPALTKAKRTSVGGKALWVGDYPYVPRLPPNFIKLNPLIGGFELVA